MLYAPCPMRERSEQTEVINENYSGITAIGIVFT